MANRSCEVATQLKILQNFKKQSQKKLLRFLKVLSIVIRTIWLYLFECKKFQFKFLYVGSTVTKFRFRLNNYKSTHRKFRKKLKKGITQEIKNSELKQRLFHEHYCSDGHKGITNWCVTLINHVKDKRELRKKELYWINKLNAWALVRLNIRVVYEAY